MNRFCSNPSCKSVAKFLCTRCNFESYCSKQCQSAAFPQHRYVCFALPSLQLFTTSSEQVEETNSFVEDEKFITQNSKTEIESLNTLNLEDSKQSVNAAALKEAEVKKTAVNMDSLQETAGEPHKLHTENTKQKDQNSSVYDKEKQHGLKVPSSVKPAFDQGARTVPPSEISRADKLSSNTVVKKVADKIDEEPVKDIQQSMENFKIKKLKEIRNSSLSSKEEKRTYISDLKQTSLSSGVIRVSILNGNPKTKIFYVVQCSPELCKNMQAIEKLIAEVVQTNNQSYKPKLNEMVLAEYESEFYRAVCTKINDENVNVFFVDFGNESSNVPYTSIRSFSPNLCFDLFVHQVYFENLPDIAKITQEQELILNNEEGLNVDVKGKNADGIYVASVVGI